MTRKTQERRKTFEATAITGLSCALALLNFACAEADEAELGLGEQGQGCSQIADCAAGLMCSEAGKCEPLVPTLVASARGEQCASPSDCGDGLFCGPQGVCTLSAGVERDQPCGLSADCKQPLVCHGQLGVCSDDGTGGSGCSSDADCDSAAGWVCGGDGSCAYPGSFGLGEACVGLTDCQRPLMCSMDFGTLGGVGECTRLPFFAGPDCIRSEEEAGAFRAYYEIPPDADALTALLDAAEPFEFYRLPFPNDLRQPEGRISMLGHAAPGQVFGVDLVGQFMDAMENELDGFATNAPIFFRFTDPLSPASLCLDTGSVYPDVPAADLTDPEAPEPEAYCADAAPASVYLVNVDANSPGFGDRVPLQLATGGASGQFICKNWLGVAPLDGQPLREGTTYAAVVTTAVADGRGDAPIQDKDFQRILERDITLSDAALAATEPLIAWMGAEGVEPGTIAAATVFTTGTPSAEGGRLRAAIDALPTPSFDANAMTCNSGASLPSPCSTAPLDLGRGCPAAAAPDFWQVQGTYQGPVFQEGTRPYLTEAMGGNLKRDASGNPAVERQETMCYAVTIPKGVTRPATGWPVVMVSHGTGGNYRAFADDPNGLVGVMNDLGFAVIGIDNVMHGPRQDPSTDPSLWLPPLWEIVDPGRYFFNVLNPAAARDNILQGAADLFYLTRLLHEAPAVSVDADNNSGNGKEIDLIFDPAQTYFFGHSQGTVIAPPYLAEQSGLAGAILSGAGAELALSILNKKNPMDIASVAGAFFGDQNLSRVHPMMGILAAVFGPSDAVNYADKFLLNPRTGRTPQPLMQFSGVGDTFTPDLTQWALMAAMGVPVVQSTAVPAPIPLDAQGIATVTGPVSDNVGTPGVTAGVIQLTPAQGEDGHFVVYDHPDAAAIVDHFLDTARAGAAEIAR